MNNLHSIVYTSTAAIDLSREDLAHLLKRSTERNLEEEITGILVFCEGKFIQYIEGPSEPLFRLYSLICTDTRHHDVIQLVNEPIAERYFLGWSMGYSNIQMMDFTRLLASPWGVLHDPHPDPTGVTGVRLLHTVWRRLKHAGY